MIPPDRLERLIYRCYRESALKQYLERVRKNFAGPMGGGGAIVAPCGPKQGDAKVGPRREGRGKSR
jgi:hypothetical protein